MGACPKMREDEPMPTAVDLLVEAFAALLVSRGAAPAGAQAVAKHQVDQILKRMGGRRVYLPKGIDFTREAREARDEAIRISAKRMRPEAVCRAFKVSRSQFYRIIRKKG